MTSEQERRFQQLADEYERWMRSHGLDLHSADEHLTDENLTQRQRDWLADFVERWETAANAEADPGSDNPFCAHEWGHDEERDRVYCMYCGADGDA